MRNAFLNALRVGGVAVGMTAYVASAQPAGIQNMDVGFPTLIGSYTVANGKMTIVGGGNDIWNTADNFHFAYISVTGDFDYVVNVEDLQGPDNWSKAELMARESGDVVDTSDRFVANMTTRSGGQNEVALQWRSDSGYLISGFGSGCAWPNDIGIASPIYRPTYPNTWLRLERIGSKFWAYAGTDGVSWTVLRGSPYDTGALNGNEAALRTDGPFTNKVALGLAVTAHNDADTTGGVAVFSEFKAYTQTPIAITTQPAATLNFAANSTLNVSVGATGDPIHYQWLKDGTEIPGAINATYSKPLCQISDSGSYTVRLYRSGQEVTSSASAITVTVDNTPPTITEVRPQASVTSLKVTFSEPVKAPSATTPSNYQLSGGVTVSSAVLAADEFSVTLTTSAQAYNTLYTLTVSNVQDSGGNPVAAGTTASFTSVSLLSGYAYYERWDDANGDLGDINAFAAEIAAGTQRAPDVTSVVNQFGGPWGVTDNYNGRVRTYFTPPSNGDYIFFVSADDGARVYLSTDDTPANKKLICQESGWSNQYQWTAPGAGAVEDKRSDLFVGTEWAGGPTITLQASQRYFMEVLWNEGGGGDGADVTFIKVGEADPANNVDGMFMKGNVISWFETADVLPPLIDTHPVDNVTIDAGGTATLSVVAHNPGAAALTYQWQKNGRDIPGATSADYVISNAKPTDIGQYWVKVSNPKATVTSGQGSPNPTVVLVKATGVFNIEAEDFDYNNGQTVAAASTMPYLGNAYTNLIGTLGVDYNNGEDSGGGILAYRGGVNDGPAIAVSDNIGGQWGRTRAGEWDMTANYKVGWVGAGDWGNYTRTFPTPAKPYYVFWAGSYDGVGAGQINGSLGKVTAGVGTATQTVEPMGTFDCVGSGDWSRNNLVALTEGAGGPIKTVELGGPVTLRWAYNSADADYLLFIPADSTPVGPKFDPPVLQADGKVVISWTGAGTLQLAPSVTGPWVDQTGVTSPLTWTPPVGTQQAYVRIKQ